jgi:hypothetical protein
MASDMDRMAMSSGRRPTAGEEVIEPDLLKWETLELRQGFVAEDAVGGRHLGVSRLVVAGEVPGEVFVVIDLDSEEAAACGAFVGDEDVERRPVSGVAVIPAARRPLEPDISDAGDLPGPHQPQSRGRKIGVLGEGAEEVEAQGLAGQQIDPQPGAAEEGAGPGRGLGVGDHLPLGGIGQIVGQDRRFAVGEGDP